MIGHNTKKLCTFTDSIAVGDCAKFYGVMIIESGITEEYISTKLEIKNFSKTGP